MIDRRDRTAYCRRRHEPQGPSAGRARPPRTTTGMTEFIPPGTRFFDLPSPFPMKRGGALHGARVAYETWGTLNAARDNAVLILTGLSPDAHAAANAGNPEAGLVGGDARPGQADRHRPLVRDLRELARQLQGLDRPGLDQSRHRRALPARLPRPVGRGRRRRRRARGARARHRAPRLRDRQLDGRHGRAGVTCCAIRASRARTSTSPARRTRCRSRSRSARCSARRSASTRTGTTAATTTSTTPNRACAWRASSA